MRILSMSDQHARLIETQEFHFLGMQKQSYPRSKSQKIFGSRLKKSGCITNGYLMAGKKR